MLIFPVSRQSSMCLKTTEIKLQFTIILFHLYTYEVCVFCVHFYVMNLVKNESSFSSNG